MDGKPGFHHLCRGRWTSHDIDTTPNQTVNVIATDFQVRKKDMSKQSRNHISPGLCTDMHPSPSLARFQAFAATDIFCCILKEINYWKLEATNYWKLEATNYWKLEATNYWDSEGLVVRLFLPPVVVRMWTASWNWSRTSCMGNWWQ